MFFYLPPPFFEFVSFIGRIFFFENKKIITLSCNIQAKKLGLALV